MIDPHSVFQIVSAAGAVIALIVLIAILKPNAFISIFPASLLLAAIYKANIGSTIFYALFVATSTATTSPAYTALGSPGSIVFLM